MQGSAGGSKPVRSELTFPYANFELGRVQLLYVGLEVAVEYVHHYGLENHLWSLAKVVSAGHHHAKVMAILGAKCMQLWEHAPQIARAYKVDFLIAHFIYLAWSVCLFLRGKWHKFNCRLKGLQPDWFFCSWVFSKNCLYHQCSFAWSIQKGLF